MKCRYIEKRGREKGYLTLLRKKEEDALLFGVSFVWENKLGFKKYILNYV